MGDIMKEEKYYIANNSPGIFYKAINIDEELAFADDCYQIVDEKIIDWLSQQKFKECGAYPNNYSTKYLDDIFPFNIQLVKQEGKYVVTQVKEEIKKNKIKYSKPKHLTYSIKEVLSNIGE